jgi:hypothetical protein
MLYNQYILFTNLSQSWYAVFCYHVITIVFLHKEGTPIYFLKLLFDGDNYALSCESSNIYSFMLWECKLLFQGWYCATPSSKTDSM